MNSVTAALASPAQSAAATPTGVAHLGAAAIGSGARPNSSFSPSGERVEKTFTPLVQQFLTYLKLEKHFSEYTVKSYGADLIQFGQFMAGEIGPQAAAADTSTAKMAVDELDKKKLACEPMTVREFLAYLYGQNYTK